MFIVAVDPGSVNAGLAITEVDRETLDIKNIVAHNISYPVLNRYDIVKPTMERSPRERTSFISERILSIVLTHEEVVAICIEEPHYDRFRPLSYGPLYSNTEIIAQGIAKRYPQVHVFKYRPMSIKKAVGASKRLANENPKAAVYRGMSGIQEIVDNTDKPLIQYTEHATDAIAITYTHLQECRNV